MAERSNDKLINAGFLVALSILTVIGFLYYSSITAMTDFARMEERWSRAMLELEGIHSALEDVETAELTVLLTGLDDEIQSYRAAVATIEHNVQSLHQLSRNHPLQLKRMERIEPLLRDKLAEVYKTMEVRRTEGFVAAYHREFVPGHERSREEIHAQLSAARDEIGQQLARRKALKEESARRSSLVVLTGSAISLGLLVSSLLLLRRDIAKRRVAEKDVKLLNGDLAARAAELESVNRELEAFNYSVSHDLRQPLNVVSSYCQVIEDLCGGDLDERCRRYLRDANLATVRMNRLIEALLQFSGMARVELRRENVDLHLLAQEVAREVRLAEPERRVVFRIQEKMQADGDPHLLRVVLENLVGNAWKYTGGRGEAVVEVGSTSRHGKIVFFVRDNGVGFDPIYQDQLFIPFKRLPGSESWRGSGIGLATVERIIRRHGGQVWAEGEPDRGATFYFTLPPESS